MNLGRDELLSKLRQMDEYEFEGLVADAWQKRGWETTVTTGSSDRGIDVIAEKSSPFTQKHLIQVKRYSVGNKIGGPDIQQYSSLRHQEDDVDAVIVLTTSSFSSEAKQRADELNVKLINGEELSEVLLELDSHSFLSNYIELSKLENESPDENSANTTCENITEDYDSVKLNYGEISELGNETPGKAATNTTSGSTAENCDTAKIPSEKQIKQEYDLIPHKKLVEDKIVFVNGFPVIKGPISINVLYSAIDYHLERVGYSVPQDYDYSEGIYIQFEDNPIPLEYETERYIGYFEGYYDIAHPDLEVVDMVEKRISEWENLSVEFDEKIDYGGFDWTSHQVCTWQTRNKRIKSETVLKRFLQIISGCFNIELENISHIEIVSR